MNDGQFLRKDYQSDLLLAILALIFGLFALIAAFLSCKSLIYMAISLLISMPSIIFSVLSLSKGRMRIGLPVTNLLLNKAAWVVMSCILLWKLYESIISLFIKKLF